MSDKACLITGIGGLIGSQCAEYFSTKYQFDSTVGIDCNARQEFFGESASVMGTIEGQLDKGYEIYNVDISKRDQVDKIFRYYGSNIDLIIHCAAQPSHDWAATNPHRDFEVNALGTLNLLEAYRQYCPNAVFIFTSTNKVYGDSPNRGNFDELETRYEPAWYKHWVNYMGYGIDGNVSIKESQSIDHTTHSLFGVSKAYADLAVQEYGRYFGLKTGVFRGGCLTGPAHQGAEQHGFLSYLVKCIKHEKPYTIYGYSGKQVRDIIHSYDVARAFDEFYANPKPGEVYNLGGGRHSNCSILEAIDIIESKTGNTLAPAYNPNPRRGDHQWYITDMSKFKRDYPNWDYAYTLEQIIDEIIQTA